MSDLPNVFVPMTVALPFSCRLAVNTSAALAVPPLVSMATGTDDVAVAVAGSGSVTV